MELCRADFLEFAHAVLLRGHFVRAACQYQCESESDSENECESESENECESESHALVPLFLDLLRQHAILKQLREGYAFWPEYELIAEAESRVCGVVADITSALCERARQQASLELSGRAASGGFYWALSDVTHRRGARGARGEGAPLTGDGFFHTLQAESRAQPEDALSCAHALMARCLLAAHGAPAPAPAREGPPSADTIVDAYYRNQPIMLYDTDISSVPWVEAVFVASVADFLTVMVEQQGWDAASHHWDFTTISVCSLLASLDRAKHAWGTTKVALVSRAVLRLLRAVCGFIARVPAESERRQPSAHVSALPAEWRDVFAGTAARPLHALLLHILETVPDELGEGKGGPMTVSRARVISELCRVLSCLEPGGALLGALETADEEEAAGREAAAAGRVLGALLPPGYKYLAHYTLRARAHTLVRAHAEKLRAWKTSGDESDTVVTGASETEDTPPLAVDYLHEPLERLQELMDAALAHLKVGVETCSTVASSDTHSLALGYLLLVAALGEQAGLQRGELALHCAELVRARRYIDRLLPIALRLLPAGCARHATDPAGAAPPATQHTDLFHTVHEFTVDEPARSEHVSGLACRALCVGVVSWGAGAARAWWGAAPGPAGRALSRLVTAHVTPRLVRQLLAAVHERAGKELPDTEVQVHWTAREVVCSTLIEEQRVELSIALSPSHPLTLPAISSPAPHPHSPVPNTQWLAVYIAYQNGSLLAALRMWVSAVTARVEASPQCYICYCRLSPATGRLPTVPCHQCRNKFHHACLTKWFQSSSKSNCPLCRSNF